MRLVSVGESQFISETLAAKAPTLSPVTLGSSSFVSGSHLKSSRYSGE